MILLSGSRRRIFDMLIEPVPILVFPLALMTVNIGNAILVAAATDALPIPITAAKLVLSVCTALGTLFLLIGLLKCVSMEAHCLADEWVLQNSGAVAAGEMALMGIGAWLHDTLDATSAAGLALWAFALVGILIQQGILVLCVVRMALSGRHATPPKPVWQFLRERAITAWVVPCVGVAAASATGSMMLREAIDSTLLRLVLLYAPLALGTTWMLILMLPLWYLVCARHALLEEPPCAILMAPPALVLAGWLGAAGDSGHLCTSALTHALAIITVISSVPIVLLTPSYLNLCRPFAPSIATVGFPLAIGAISLLRYQAVVRASAHNATDVVIDAACNVAALPAGSIESMNVSMHFAWADRIGASALLLIATLAALVINARFAVAAGRHVIDVVQVHHKMAGTMPRSVPSRIVKR